MEHVAQGFLIFFGVAIVSAIVWHALLERYAMAIVGAALTSVVVSHVALFIKSGFLEAFFPMLLAIAVVESIVVAALVGLPFKLRREARRKRQA